MNASTHHLAPGTGMPPPDPLRNIVVLDCAEFRHDHHGLLVIEFMGNTTERRRQPRGPNRPEAEVEAQALRQALPHDAGNAGTRPQPACAS